MRACWRHPVPLAPLLGRADRVVVDLGGDGSTLYAPGEAWIMPSCRYVPFLNDRVNAKERINLHNR